MTLHVGAGTFQPVRVHDLAEHRMHKERYSVPQATVDAIAACRAHREKGGRVVAVGTTTLRTLETAALDGELKAGAGESELFVTPGFEFKVVDILLTTGASRSMADAPAATADCPAVSRLRSAGAVLVGHTNLSEFAFSGVGINPHHGTPVNPASPAGQALIPGGSTSGGAVSVAVGEVFAALGSGGRGIGEPPASC